MSIYLRESRRGSLQVLDEVGQTYIVQCNRYFLLASFV